MRRIGALWLIGGLAAAGCLYLLETWNAGPSMDELLPGYSKANSRLMGIFYGHAGETMWSARQTLERPGVQAGIVIAIATIVALICFRIAWLDDDSEREP